MLTMLQTLDGWAEGWLKVMGAFLWQSTLLVAVAALVAWCLRRSSPVVRYWLWQIVAIKLLLMPFWSLAVPLPSWAWRTPPSQPATSAAGPSLRRPKSSPMTRAGGSSASISHAAARGRGSRLRKSPSMGRSLGGDFLAGMALSAWLAVIVWQLLGLLRQRVWLARLLRRRSPPTGSLPRLVAELAGTLDFAARPGRLCRWPGLPAVCLRAVATASGIARSSDVVAGSRRAPASHPARAGAHVKRRDLLWGWTAEIARMVYFFHPLVWWAGYRLRLERELACDQLAMAVSGHPPADYAQTLVQVVSHASEQAGVQAAAISAELTGNQSSPKGES